MKGVRFYEEYKDKAAKRKGTESEGNVIAVFVEHAGESLLRTGCHEAVGAVYFEPNSPVGGTQVSPGVLRDRCKRVSEAKAREVHPALFEYLDD